MRNFTLLLNDSVVKRLQELQGQLHLKDTTEMQKWAFAVADSIAQAHLAGSQIIFRDPAGNEQVFDPTPDAKMVKG